MRFVAIRDLKPGMILGRKIHTRNKATLLEKGVELTPKFIERLRKDGYLGAYITDAFSKDIKVAETVSEQTIEAAIDAVANVDIDNILRAASNLIMEISALEEISLDLLDIRSYDDYTYHHTVNVAIYSVAVAIKMGLSLNQLNEVAISALCHDLGKTRIDTAILNKKDRLTDAEFEEIRRHPQYSYELISSNPLVNMKIRQAVLSHHENENGSGYPYGKTGEEIPLYAKIIHAVDVFDALTSNRPYKDPCAPIEALEYLIGGEGILFDSKVVETVQAVIPPYPPGMDVILSNGERAVVTEHTSQTLRPRIKIYETGKVVDLSRDLRYRMVFIRESGYLMKESIAGIDTKNGEPVGETGPKKTILVVDDSRISLEQTRSALEDEYIVTTLESAAACFKYLEKKGAPDLLIMDIDMPVMDGLTAVKTIRKTYPDMNVIFLTAIANRDTVVRCNKVGAKDYILKPVNPVYLRERIEIALDKNLDR